MRKEVDNYATKQVMKQTFKWLCLYYVNDLCVIIQQSRDLFAKNCKVVSFQHFLLQPIGQQEPPLNMTVRASHAHSLTLKT